MTRQSVTAAFPRNKATHLRAYEARASIVKQSFVGTLGWSRFCESERGPALPRPPPAAYLGRL